MEAVKQSLLNVSLVLFMAIALPIALILVLLSIAKTALWESFIPST